MRSVWSGNLVFGLVSIPVRMVPATEAKDVRFHLVDPATGRRVRYRRVVERDLDVHEGPPDEPVMEATDEPRTAEPTEEVPVATESRRADERDGEPGEVQEVEMSFGELARGYELPSGEQVIVSLEELADVRPEPSRSIEIEGFVDLADVDPVYFEKSYVLTPGWGAVSEHPYHLLVSALERAGRAGIGRFVLRTKPHLVAIRSRSGILALETLFFGDEVRDASALVASQAPAAVEPRELDLAEKLIAMLATEWDPSAYADIYREELLTLIQRKAPRPLPAEEVKAPQGSAAEALMDALRRSVEEAKERQAPRRSHGASEAS